MAEWTLLETRRISGKGVLRVPTGQLKFRAIILYIDVIRFATSKYVNKNYLPDRGKHGFLTFHRNGYVIDSNSVEFEKQSYDGIQDWAGQALIAVKCAYDGTLKSFANLGQALGVTPISITDLIKDYENLNMSWDEVRVNCYADTALQLRLYSLQYDTCTPDRDDQKRPPLPPPLPPRVPPGTPITDLDAPYDSGDTTTLPYAGDKPKNDPSKLPANTDILWNFSTNRNPRLTKAQAGFTAKAPITNYRVTRVINEDIGINATNWEAKFNANGVERTGSAVGNRIPEDKPVMVIFLSSQGANESPWAILTGS